MTKQDKEDITALLAARRPPTWSTRKIIAVISGVLLTIGGGGSLTHYIGTRQSTVHADANQAKDEARETFPNNHITREAFDIGQNAQNDLLGSQLLALKGSIEKLDGKLDRTSDLVQRIAGKLEVKTQVP